MNLNDTQAFLALDKQNMLSQIDALPDQMRLAWELGCASHLPAWDQVQQIAESKMSDLNCFTTEAAMRLVAGTARSMGITVEGNAPFNH